MLFHTWPFLIFMLVVLPVFFALRRTRLWIPWLMAASYFFYGWWNPYYLLAGRLLDGAGLPAGDVDGPLPAGRAAARPGRCDAVLQAALWRCPPALALALVAAGHGRAGHAAARCRWPWPCLVLLMAVGACFGSRRIWLLISLVNNLALLLFFKYARFVVENLNQVLAAGSACRCTWPIPRRSCPTAFSYVLPVGISFFTFQSMSYTIDFYLGKVARERNFLRFATFVCFFPQLMAGPIERAKHLLPQFQQAPPLRLQNLTDGLSLFLVGPVQEAGPGQLPVAVRGARLRQPQARSSASALVLATFAFAWQIFFDFSGYTDMARGVARMMGFNLILNFNNPYLATGLGEFWSRWHISLSTWFRDYVYIPLGGSRRGTLATYRNLFITFLVSGIWHGANWTFAIWGMLHAFGVMLTRELERSAVLPRPRARDVQAGLGLRLRLLRLDLLPGRLAVATPCSMIRRIGQAAWSSPQIPALMLLWSPLVWLYQFIYESRLRRLLRDGPVRVTLAAGMMLYLCLCSSGGGTFIYFQF